jgi:hypothetical protein
MVSAILAGAGGLCLAGAAVVYVRYQGWSLRSPYILGAIGIVLLIAGAAQL